MALRRWLDRRMRWLFLSFLAVIAFGLASACGPAGSGGGMLGDLGGEDPEEGGISEVPNPTPEMAARSGKSLDRLQQGHVIYMLKCAECHGYILPKSLDLEDWEDAMPEMIRHAGLPGADEKAVLDYVIAVKQS